MPSTSRTLALGCGAVALTTLLTAGPAVTAGVAGPPGTTASAASAAAKERWQLLTPSSTGIPGDYVYSLAIDDRDRVFVAGDDPVWDEGGLGVRKPSGVWDQWTNVDGKAPTHLMRNVAIGPDGRTWAASERGLLARRGGEVRVVWSTRNTPWPIDAVRDFDWDTSGNLWVALDEPSTSHGGVARYDGSSWQVWTTADGLPWASPHDSVSALEIDAQDRVWIGSPTQGGAVLERGEWSALEGSTGYSVEDIEIAPDGTPWYGSDRAGVRTWEGGEWISRTPVEGPSGVSDLQVDREGRMWVAITAGKVWRWAGTGSEWDLSYEAPTLTHTYAIAFDSANRLHTGGIGGTNVLEDDGSWAVWRSTNTGLPSRWGKHVMVDDRDHVWISTNDGGVGHLDGRRWTGYNPGSWGAAPWPFEAHSATSTAQDEDGAVWMSPVDEGVGRWDGRTWTTHLPGTSIESITVDASGDVWAMPEQWEVQRWDGRRWRGMGNPTAGAELTEITAAPDGSVWMSSANGLLHWADGTWMRHHPGNSGLPSTMVRSVAVAPDGTVWAGTEAGLARFDGADWDVFTEADGLPADNVTTVATDREGEVWVGAFDGQTWPYHGGVARYDGTRWTSYTEESSPLPHEQVESVAVDRRGRVWIATAVDGVAVLRP